MSLTQDLALCAVREYLARRACEAPREDMGFLLERCRKNHELEHLPRLEQQKIWHGWKRTPPPVQSSQNYLNYLPSVETGLSVFGDERIVRFDVVGELAFRDSPAELAERAAGATQIEIKINTAGGNGEWAHEFGTRLRAIGCKIVATAEHAFSAGALLMQYAHKRRIRSTGRVLIHGPQFAFLGGAEDFRRLADWLDISKVSDVALFLERTNQSRETVESWLSRDSYFSPEEAIAHGLADEIVD